MGAARAEPMTKMEQTNPITIPNTVLLLTMSLPPFSVLTLHLKKHLYRIPMVECLKGFLRLIQAKCRAHNGSGQYLVTFDPPHCPRKLARNQPDIPKNGKPAPQQVHGADHRFRIKAEESHPTP